MIPLKFARNLFFSSLVLRAFQALKPPTFSLELTLSVIANWIYVRIINSYWLTKAHVTLLTCSSAKQDTEMPRNKKGQWRKCLYLITSNGRAAESQAGGTGYPGYLKGERRRQGSWDCEFLSGLLKLARIGLIKSFCQRHKELKRELEMEEKGRTIQLKENVFPLRQCGF